MNIKEVLFKLDDFCNANKIEYTGTVALVMLGVPSNPNDIDIKSVSPERRAGSEVKRTPIPVRPGQRELRRQVLHI